MKLIVAGSRGWSKKDWLFKELDRLHKTLPITEVVSGGAVGADKLGELWAASRKVPVKVFPAKWRRGDGLIDKAAGFKRNTEMAKYGEALAAFMVGETSGTKHMIQTATNRRLPVFLFTATT